MIGCEIVLLVAFIIPNITIVITSNARDPSASLRVTALRHSERREGPFVFAQSGGMEKATVNVSLRIVTPSALLSF